MDASQSWIVEHLSSLQKSFARILSTSGTNDENHGGPFLLIVFFFTVAVASLIWLISQGKRSTPPLPPGSFGLPIIGDTISYISAYRNMNTKKWIEEKKKKHGPLFKTSILFQKTVFLDEPGGCKLMFGQPDEKLIRLVINKANLAVGGPGSLILQNGQVHTTYRKYLITHFLGVDAVGRYLPVMEQNALDHIQRYWLSKEDGARVVARDLFEMFTFSNALELMLSLRDVAQVQELRSLFAVYSMGFMSTPINLPGFQFHRSLKCRDKIHRIFQKSIEKRRVELKEGLATPNQDYLSVLLTQPDGNGHFHTDEQIPVLLTNNVWASTDTTAATMSMVLRALSRHPEVYEKLIEEHRQIAQNKTEGEPLSRQKIRSMKYTWAVIQETLRLTPAITDINRQAMADIHYKGYVIPKGYKLVCSAVQSMWNPEVYPDPEKFDPSRFIRTGATKSIEPFTFFAFGGSTRYCPGQEFAKLSLLTFFHHFFKNLVYTLEEPEERVLYRFMVYPEKGLPLRIQKCKVY
ncbi:hypothetical protein R1sor_020661 [Riccia sorocarpa]|uniref:Cytochrome P450 n=1 Tax=Riccia sorocarpa TaxID=122646 RepID=A0ABD3GHZ3_9MARC